MFVGTTNFETKSRRRKTKEVRSARNEQQNNMPKTNIENVRELLRGSTYMQYMEDTFGTGSTFRSGGSWKFQSDPIGGKVEI
jgi:hypothetical protein